VTRKRWNFHLFLVTSRRGKGGTFTSSWSPAEEEEVELPPLPGHQQKRKRWNFHLIPVTSRQHRRCFVPQVVNTV
jgi:hypothetical protein